MKRSYLVTLAVLAGMLAMPDAASACEMCFGAIGDNPTIQAISASMMVLLFVVTGVGGGIFRFFTGMQRRAAELEESGKHQIDEQA